MKSFSKAVEAVKQVVPQQHCTELVMSARCAETNPTPGAVRAFMHSLERLTARIGVDPNQQDTAIEELFSASYDALAEGAKFLSEARVAERRGVAMMLLGNRAHIRH